MGKRDAARRLGPAGRISKLIGRAIGDYDLIADGDRILVAVSGGKDSFALLHQLQQRRAFAPVDFALFPVYVHAGDACGDGLPADVLAASCEKLGLPLHVLETEVRVPEGRRLDCHRCATARRQALFRHAKELDANKLALGHHLDDICETALMNLFFQGNVSTMTPRQELFEGGLTIIRPLALVPEADIITYVDGDLDFPRERGSCPVGKDTQRARMKALIHQLERDNPDVRQSIFAGLHNVKTEYLP